MTSNIVELPKEEIIQIRALCDEIMNNLCQVKALIFPVNINDFFEFSDVEVLRHYFYAIDSIIESTLATKDSLYSIVACWEQRLQDN